MCIKYTTLHSLAHYQEMLLHQYTVMCEKLNKYSIFWTLETIGQGNFLCTFVKDLDMQLHF